MARNRKKMPFYEVVGRAQPKSRKDKTLGHLAPERPGRDMPVEADSSQLGKTMAIWPRRPRIVQFNAGRIELSLPYQLAIAILLGLILLILVAFRLGQNLSAAKLPDVSYPAAKQVSADTAQMPETAEKTVLAPAAAEKQRTEPAKAKSDHRIVITQYNTRRDIEPVQKYFADNGIETMIEKRGGRFFLVTKDTYENPQRQGTDGFAAKQKIIKAGAKYKAPKGYESFAPRLFSDAYGEKIK